MPARRTATKSSIQKKRKLATVASPPSPPRILLPPLLLKSWAFVRDAEEAQGRTLAPLTGSKLEAQLLIHRIEVRCALSCVNTPCAS
jgi:hypothetical protein